ncbi:MAG: hypothetical protein GEU99_21285 [Luteitalea sp.]|nr:hypothetical protein [Luteitalea sp.]
MDSGEIKKRLRHTIDRARRETAARRQTTEQARADWERVLEHATPLCRQLVQALRAEGVLFTLGTPAGELRLDADRTPSDYIALSLDTFQRPATVVGHVSYVRGQRVVVNEHIVADATDIAALTEERVLAFLLDAIVPFVER